VSLSLFQQVFPTFLLVGYANTKREMLDQKSWESKWQLQLILIAGRHFCAMQSIGKVLLN